MSAPGERRVQILQALAAMLEAPGGEKITTAALAARLQVSEAALYRHFASKAQMFEGLMEYIESTLFGFINRINGEERDGLRQIESILRLLLTFAERNRGMTRVLTGEALVHENTRLLSRMNQLFDRVESSIKQSLRIAASQQSLAADADPAVAARLLFAWTLGRWQLFTRSAFRASPMEGWDAQWALLRKGLV
jgi:TetR/AcrR family transcriptional regulator